MWKRYLFKYSTQISIGLVIMVFLIIFLLRRKKRKPEKVDDAVLPPGVAPDAGTNSANNDAVNVRNTAISLYNNMKGINFTSNELQIIEGLTNQQLVDVYNKFNKLYGKEGHGTLRNWLESELYSPFTIARANRIITRFNILGLT